MKREGVTAEGAKNAEKGFNFKRQKEKWGDANPPSPLWSGVDTIDP
jgi:hypothetical protein